MPDLVLLAKKGEYKVIVAACMKIKDVISLRCREEEATTHL